jgi:hypothetical protein
LFRVGTTFVWTKTTLFRVKATLLQTKTTLVCSGTTLPLCETTFIHVNRTLILFEATLLQGQITWFRLARRVAPDENKFACFGTTIAPFKEAFFRAERTSSDATQRSSPLTSCSRFLITARERVRT